MTPRLDLVGTVASDMARTLDFYRRLGLDIPAGAETEPHVEVTLPTGLRLAWDTEEVMRAMDPHWTRSQGGGASLAFRCDSPAEVDRYYAELTEAGYTGHLKPWDAPWGQRYAVLLDPDATPVDLFAPLPTP
ncbi:VOC family protein [Micromonospora fluostatini]|uniref:VOC family protein n=1 Tax=Micromonospora sp. JCM 30529 TaxID=3421643 RepID=UPI003D16E8E4